MGRARSDPNESGIDARKQAQGPGTRPQSDSIPAYAGRGVCEPSRSIGYSNGQGSGESVPAFHRQPQTADGIPVEPRCCLTGKEQTLSRYRMVESRWGYSGTSDRIRFRVNKRIFVVGFGLYGSIHGPADYSVKIEIIHSDSGEVPRQNDTAFSCNGSDSTFRVMFKNPVEVGPNMDYIASATLKGPDSHYGTHGVKRIVHESVSSERVVFNFSLAMGNNNGTSVEDGQIPELIFYT
ncbi:putative BTB/POZ domain-containing protein 2 [Apostichopus japonicus]|uniref:Putative BTB/POZ domain-containing protein 2 n=1 Tax=Stichopus japonicus TaxID=307972 RepID=A0A2G8LLM2_STIJA|nr:putative BTB/POZ domain-containing protein 2 [Apostichopus japonicus]